MKSKTSNIKTDSVKFFRVWFLYLLAFSLTGCGRPALHYAEQDHQDEILGGKIVQASSVFAKKVLYLALGVNRTKTKFGTTMTFEKVCTASAISKNILLTAAHCVTDLKPSEINVAVSSNPLKTKKLDSSAWVNVEIIEIHPQYKMDPSIANDVALIKLSSNLPTERISKLIEPNQVTKNMQMILVGFGVTNTDESISSNASKDSDSLLNYVLKNINYNPLDQKIIVNQTDQSGICSGDSGSPGFIYDKARKEFAVIGIASYVFQQKDKLAGEMEPCHGTGVYMNVLTFKKWILETSLKLQR